MRIIVLLFLLLPVIANAVQVNVQWTPAKTFDNDLPMKYEEIAGFQVHYSVDAELEIIQKPIWVNGVNKYTLNLELKPRNEPYKIRVGVQTVDIYGATSKLSNVITQDFTVKPTSSPNAPAITIEISCGADCDRIIVTKK